ncbi:hypothetical protein Tsubulata_003237 [Turnera subulata]|uniref:DUF3511 domain-containing protein n=1 Tax=Turnera subulata TaxID=218843 RepID=A0A9Q0GMW1_9ROSI|nr:hypothetical protein Tsubulata_003237 [Turnera subulata]
MEDFRSKSCREGRMQIEAYRPYPHHYGGPGGAAVGPAPPFNGMQDLRCYSASYASSTHTQMGNGGGSSSSTSNDYAGGGGGGHNDVKFKKGKSTNGVVSKSWSFADPELQRKRRVASYKVYSVEGKVKGSLKKSFRWVKDRCTRAVYGWW